VSEVDLLPALQLLKKPIMLRLPASSLTKPDTLKELMERSVRGVKYFLFEEERAAEPQALATVLSLSQHFPILLGFGMTAENIHTLLEQGAFEGIALRGGDEIKAGYKDFDDLADVLEAIEIDDLA